MMTLSRVPVRSIVVVLCMVFGTGLLCRGQEPDKPQDGALSAMVEIGRRGRVLLVTCSDDDRPHVSEVGSMKPGKAGELVLRYWFGNRTTGNIGANPHVSVLVLAPRHGAGYQADGIVTDIQDVSFLNGYSPKEIEQGGVPQVERRVVIRVEQVARFPEHQRPVTDDRSATTGGQNEDNGPDR